MNQPERYESYVLEPDQTKMTYITDTRMKNCGTFKVLKEDHTLGNIIRMQLLQDESIIFAGYKVPHPLDHELIIKVRTDGSKTTVGAMLDATEELIQSLKFTSEKLWKQVAQKNDKRGVTMNFNNI
mmetsp:Transcript_61681/g.75627  ORF Transcript_61681/g.75627 Transcript_61681/m.75627 type:complete len:126 (+) Transcript_61681:49-426(+)